MNKYDIVIIGSGLGGLLCAYILSKEGYSVCILEKNHQIGGNLQTFRRDGHTFDTGLHYIGGLDEGQNLNQFFKYFGLMDKLKFKRMDETGFDIFNFGSDNTSYKYAMGYNNFIEELAKSFPSERENLKNYCNELQQACKSISLYNLEAPKKDEADSVYRQINTYDFIKSITNDKRLQSVLAALNSLYAGDTDMTPLYVHAMINNLHISSSWRLQGGGHQIADALAESIKENGGDIYKNYEVEKFVFQDDKVKSVRLKNNEIIEGKTFISNVHPSITVDMIEKGKIRPAFRKRINSLENTVSAFCLYIVLKKNSFKYINHNHYYYKGNNVWTSKYDKNNWPESFLFLTPYTSSEYAETAKVICYMNIEDVAKWNDTSIGKRGDSYLDFKEKSAEKLLELLNIQFPGFSQNIEKYYTSSPLTIRDYTASKNGSMYGIMKDYKNPLATFVYHKTKIPNLLFTGQNLSLHGILGVTISSLVTCSELVDIDYLLKKIKSA